MKFNLLLAVILIGLSPKYQAQYQFNLMEDCLDIIPTQNLKPVIS